ncbi:hypothetical protein EMIT07CA2_160107 [Brevibacillus sp. IT-7CA2]|uniref:hypothetical protein n=1 Tax=Brevibacillus sp. IT-7CA2 TaxID=3026436 RepID=UPI0039E16693
MFNWFTVDLAGINIFSLIQLENTLLVVLFSLAVTKLIEHLKEAPALYISGLMYIAGYSLIMYSNSLIVILAAVLINTMGELIHAPIRQTYLAQIVKDDLRSSYMAVNGLVVPGARIIGGSRYHFGSCPPDLSNGTPYLFSGGRRRHPHPIDRVANGFQRTFTSSRKRSCPMT